MTITSKLVPDDKTTKSDRVFLTKEQALSVLHDGYHGMKPGHHILCGFDMTAEHAKKIIDESYSIELTGYRARGMGHGMIAYNPDGSCIGLRTDEEKLLIVEMELVNSGREHEAAPQWWRDGKRCPYE